MLTSLGIWGLHTWWANFGIVMRALVPFFLLVSGLVALFSSYYRMSGDDEEEAGEEPAKDATDEPLEART